MAQTKEEKRKGAKERQALRDLRSPKEQIDVIIARCGGRAVGCKEIERLQDAS